MIRSCLKKIDQWQSRAVDEACLVLSMISMHVLVLYSVFFCFFVFFLFHILLFFSRRPHVAGGPDMIRHISTRRGLSGFVGICRGLSGFVEPGGYMRPTIVVSCDN